MGNTPAVVRPDTGIELRDGHLKFEVEITPEPYIKQGPEELSPTHAVGTASLKDGAWQVGFVHIYGSKIGRKGAPIKKGIHFSYSFDTLDENERWHPDYTPPQRLVDFVAAFENRLNGRTEASA